MKVVAALNRVDSEVRASALSAAGKLDLLTRINEKQQQAERALNLALGVSLMANVTNDLRPHLFRRKLTRKRQSPRDRNF